MGEWRYLSVDEIKDESPSSIAIGPFGSRMKADCYTSSGVRIIRGNNITATRALSGEFVHVSTETADGLRSSNVIEGDLVFPHRGAIGEVGIVPCDGHRYMLSTSLMKLSCNRNIVEPLFVFYYFRSAMGRHELMKNASTVGTPGIATPLTSLKAIMLPVPPLSTQRAIAHILGALDDKIELNRQMNATLEAMARAIFKSWFIDFDPVRAQAAGEPLDSICRRLHLTPEILSLFPDRFQDSELGNIPEGWEVKPLDQIASYLNGLALQKFPPHDDESLPAIKIAQLRAGHAEGADRVGADVPPEYIVDNGDVLFSWSGSLEVEIWCGGKGALNQHLFKVTSEFYPRWFYFLWTRNYLEEFRDIAANKATTMGHINRNHLSAASVLIPEAALLEGMTRILEPLIDKQIETRIESRSLAETRDTLLPRLISGDICVPA